MLIGITGHRGILGTIIKSQLDKLHMSYTCFEGDITDTEDIHQWTNNNITHIIHLAAIVPVNMVNADPERSVQVNVQGTINLMNVLSKQQTRPYIFYASTCHIYKSAALPLKETDTIEPINLYGMTKYVSEVVLENYASQEKYPLCIGRIFSFYHDSQKIPFLYPSILKRLKEEDLDQPFFLRGANSIRDLSNAEAICSIILKLVQKGSTGRFNIGTGKGITIKDFVQSLSAKQLNVKIDEQEKLHYLVADISKLKNELNIHE